MVNIKRAVDILVLALSTEGEISSDIKQFQLMIRKRAPKSDDKPQWDVLSELSYDLDYYEPSAEIRKEDPSYFGDERARREIHGALVKLKKMGVRIPEVSE